MSPRTSTWTVMLPSFWYVDGRSSKQMVKIVDAMTAAVSSVSSMVVIKDVLPYCKIDHSFVWWYS
jgi:hypothetical protein